MVAKKDYGRCMCGTMATGAIYGMPFCTEHMEAQLQNFSQLSQRRMEESISMIKLSVRKRAKIYAIQHNMTFSEVVEKALISWLASNHGDKA